MTNTQKFILDNYKEISALDSSGKIILVQNISNKRIYVKKYLNIKMFDIYKTIKEINSIFFSNIEFILNDENEIIIIEEYIQGENLQQYIKNKGPLSEKSSLKYFYNLCAATEELHKHGIIHRDLSPKNIMLTSEGNLKIIDFDISRFGGKDKNYDTAILGTVGFASPEQFGFAETDEKSDIYSLGAILNYMLTGKLINEKITENKSLYHIIKKCTEISANDRYNSIKELKRSIKINTIKLKIKNPINFTSAKKHNLPNNKKISYNKKNKKSKGNIHKLISVIIYVIGISVLINMLTSKRIDNAIDTFSGYFFLLLLPLWMCENKFNWQNKLKIKNVPIFLKILICIAIWIIILILYITLLESYL